MPIPKVVMENPWMCGACRGIKHLCGESPCPLIKEVSAQVELSVPKENLVFGSSPPAAFVGEWGYPRVLAGPLLPNVTGNTSDFDSSQKWLDLPFSTLVTMRLSLIRAMHPESVVPEREERKLELMQQIAMSNSPVDAELRLVSPPRTGYSFSFFTSPMGPAGMLEKVLYVGNPKVPRAVEKAVADRDLRAADALHLLWSSGLTSDQLNRLLSVGALGIKRRLVPTRWSITAVDDSVSKRALSEVKNFPLINNYYVGKSYALGNRFSVLILPRRWEFEMLESWAPFAGCVDTGDVPIPSDYEGHAGRRGYAKNIAGAYYAARVPIAEWLLSLRRQGAALVLMEVDSSWLAPLGVWRVREGVRRAILSAVKQDGSSVAFESALRGMITSRRSWIKSSTILQELKHYISLDQFTSSI